MGSNPTPSIMKRRGGFQGCGISHASTTTLRRILSFLRLNGWSSKREIKLNCPGSQRQQDDALSFLMHYKLIKKKVNRQNETKYTVVGNEFN